MTRRSTHTETKQEKGKGALAWHMLMMSQRTKEGGLGIYKRGFTGIMREAQLGITLTILLILISSNIFASLYSFSSYLGKPTLRLDPLSKPTSYNLSKGLDGVTSTL